MELLCTREQLDLAHTLVNGQAFRWHCDASDRWTCVLRDRTDEDAPHVLVRLEAVPDGILCATEPAGKTDFVRDYLRLAVDLPTLVREFGRQDPAIAPAIAAFPGLRVLRQDPVECLFSFLCTSAAPLHRIRRSIDGLCRRYGTAVPSPLSSEKTVGSPIEGRRQREVEPPPSLVGGGASLSERGWVFPEIEALAEASIDDMKTMGLGYRARFVQATARRLRELGGASVLLALRRASYADAKAFLVALPGVGEKIADCVCLFSLDKDDAVPVDTHMRQIAERHYGISPGTSMTPAAYARIAGAIRDRFGPMAGWAQQYLFFEDLYEKRAWSAFERQWRSES